MTRLSCHRFRSNEVRLWLSLIAATAGEDRRQTGQACAVLLADAGREPSHTAAVWEHDTADRCASNGDRVAGGRCLSEIRQTRTQGPERCL
jgi:hypothetical protein